MRANRAMQHPDGTKQAPQGPWLAIVLVALLGFGACSKVLNFDPNGLPCDTTVRQTAAGAYTYFCNAGYSCEFYDANNLQCLRDHSVKSGQLCTQGRQCATDAICAIDLLGGGGVHGKGGVLSCLPSCAAQTTPEPYLHAGGCADSEAVCYPFLDASAKNSNKNLIGGCVAGNTCKGGSSCLLPTGASGTCVQIGPSATACLLGCQVTWNGSTYSDSCDALTTCQPVGLNGQQQFACMYNGVTSSATPLASIDNMSVKPLGSACAPVSAPCAKGAVCTPGSSTCAAYCQLTSNGTSSCPTAQQCCPFASFAVAPATTGYCAASCGS